MATAAVNRAVVTYRKLVRKEIEEEDLNRQLQRDLFKLNEDEMKAYFQLTVEIDHACEAFRSQARHWSPATRKARLSQLLNEAGKDVS